MKVNPSSPALLGDAPNPESVLKQALANAKASGYPKISIREMEKKTAKLPKILRIYKEIAKLKVSMNSNADEVGEVIEALESAGFKVEAKNPTTFIVYKVFLSVI